MFGLHARSERVRMQVHLLLVISDQRKVFKLFIVRCVLEKGLGAVNYFGGMQGQRAFYLQLF